MFNLPEMAPRPLRVTSGNAPTDRKISAWPSEADIFAFMGTRPKQRTAIRFVEIDTTQPSRRPYRDLRFFFVLTRSIRSIPIWLSLGLYFRRERRIDATPP